MKMLRVPEVLLLACDADERAILQKVLEPHAELTCVCTPQEMAEQLKLMKNQLSGAPTSGPRFSQASFSEPYGT